MDDGEEEDEQSQTVTIALDLPSGGDLENSGTDQNQQQQQQLEQQQLLIGRNDEHQQNAKLVVDDDDADAAFLTICSPPSSSDLLHPWRRHLRQNANGICEDKNNNGSNKNGISAVPTAAAGGIVRVRHLRAEMAQLLEQRLNPPGCGSMRNWEFVAAHLGLDIDQIVQMRRRTKNPMGALMRRFGEEPLLKILELIGEAERIDVLISIRQFAAKPMGADECHRRPEAPQSLADPALINNSSSYDSASISHNSPSTSSTALVRSLINNASDGPQAQQQNHQKQQRFILILHHENQRNRELRKFHKMLIKNLEIYAQEEGIKIVDVDQCMSDQDLLGSVSRHFDRADQVVMELSPDYAELISAADHISPSDQPDDQQPQIDQRVRMKLYLHQMTYNEVLFNANQNRRFRVVLMQGCRPEHIPRGWPGNTLHYRFPQDFESLCQRLFEPQQKQQQKGQQKMKMMMTN
ncbi:hypothetical protein niasHS_001894 [Heterodera schachtii]|uniref:Uncharacterized protein n=1 Tax=Heterodera schachtii TaxID=97005 RepID=A0ABD2KBC3_HETSC